MIAGGLLLVSACGPKPRPDAAFQGPPVSTQRCDDGLVVHTIKPGQGPAARWGDRGRIHYVVHVQGGAEVARSHDRKPMYVPVGRKGALVEGLHRALVGMKVGELRRIEVPKDLGFRGRKIPGVPPEARLEMWIELFEISKGPGGPDAARGVCPS